jgi:hypothetical protein
MSRHVEWPKRLRRMVDAARTVEHSWGPHDCASFSLRRCYWAVTGRLPPINYFHKTYSDEAGADEVLAQMNCADIEEVAETFLERRANLADVERGDIGIVMDSGRKVLVVCYGAVCLAPGLRCLHIVPRSALIAAFEVH